MATHDYAIADQSGLSFLSDLNNALAAIVSNNSSATEPTDTYPYMWWVDTTSNILKQRNATDDGWIEKISLAGTALETANNLSDLASAATARTNLGLVIGTDVQAYSALLDDAVTENSIGRKNFIINGGMAVAQRPNYVHTASANAYGQVDRMRSAITATSVSAVSLQATYAAASSGYAMQIGNVATTGSTDVSCITRLESKDTKYLNGNPITVSVSVNQNSGATRTAQVVIRKAGAVDNFATDSLISVSAGISVPSGVNTKLTHTITLGATDGDNGIAVSVFYQALPAQSNTQFYFYDFQLEKGSVATDFEQRPIGEELALCQRYLTKAGKAFGTAINGSQMTVFYHLPASMRTTPTAVVYNSAPTGESPIAVASRTGSGSVITVFTFFGNTLKVTINGFSGMTAQNTAFVNEFFNLDAEL